MRKTSTTVEGFIIMMRWENMSTTGCQNIGNIKEKNVGKNKWESFLTPQESPGMTCLKKYDPMALCVSLCANLCSLHDVYSQNDLWWSHSALCWLERCFSDFLGLLPELSNWKCLSFSANRFSFRDYCTAQRQPHYGSFASLKMHSLDVEFLL